MPAPPRISPILASNRAAGRTRSTARAELQVRRGALLPTHRRIFAGLGGARDSPRAPATTRRFRVPAWRAGTFPILSVVLDTCLALCRSTRMALAGPRLGLVVDVSRVALLAHDVGSPRQQRDTRLFRRRPFARACDGGLCIWRDRALAPRRGLASAPPVADRSGREPEGSQPTAGTPRWVAPYRGARDLS
jgi:hypothetical protein